MSRYIDPEALARKDDAALVNAYKDAGRAPPSEFVTAAADAAAAGANPTAEPTPSADGANPGQDASPSRVGAGDAPASSQPAAEPEPAPAAAATDAPARDPESGKFVTRKTKIKVADGDEVEHTDEELRALVLAERNRPMWEGSLAEQRAALERERAAIAQERQALANAQRDKAEGQRAMDEATRLRNFVLYAEQERDAGRIPSIGEFLRSQGVAGAAAPTQSTTTAPAAGTPAPLTEERFHQLLSEDRARQRAEWDRQAMLHERDRKAAFFDSEVEAAIKGSAVLKDDADLYVPAVADGVGRMLVNRKENILAVQDAAMRSLIREEVARWEARKTRNSISAAGAVFEAHKGKPLPAATPAQGTGTPTPSSAATAGDPWSEENIARLNDKFRGDPMKVLSQLDRDELKFNREMARAPGVR